MKKPNKKFFMALSPYERQTSMACPVHLIGVMPQTPASEDKVFDNAVLSISVLIKGSGTVSLNNISHDLSAPCVFIQWPGTETRLRYDVPSEELLLQYKPECVDQLMAQSLLNKNDTVWFLREPSIIGRMIRDLKESTRLMREPWAIDQFDFKCLSLLATLQRYKSTPHASEEERKIREIQSYAEAHLHEAVDFDHMAMEHGFSTSSFRRFWRRYVGRPPQRYLNDVRIRQACRMLVEGEQPMYHIAHSLGYPDPLYFSRRFHKDVGMSPSDYRKTYSVASMG